MLPTDAVLARRHLLQPVKWWQLRGMASGSGEIGSGTLNQSTYSGCGPIPEDADAEGSSLVALGIVLGLSASIGINLGNNMQSLGMHQQELSGSDKKTKTFWIGTYMFAIASIINFAAFGFAPASTLAPLESVQFVTNLLFARVRRTTSANERVGSVS